MNNVPPNPDNFNESLEIQQAVVVLLNSIFDGAAKIEVVNSHQDTEYKNDEYAQVVPLTLKLYIDFKSLNQFKLEKIKSDLLSYFTNPEIYNAFVGLVDIFKRLVISTRDRLPSDVEILTSSQLSSITDDPVTKQPAVNSKEIERLLRSKRFSVETVREVMRGKMPMVINLVYKKLKGTEKIAEAVKKEIDLYEAYYREGFNTFCAAKVVFEKPGFAVMYTVFNPRMILLKDIPNLFDHTNGIFELLMMELTRLHRAGLTHGDLHLRNIAYDSEHKVWFFDLTRGSYKPGAAETNIANDSFLLINNLAGKFRMEAEAGKLTNADRLSAIAAIDKYLNVIIGPSKPRSGLLSRIPTPDPIVTSEMNVETIKQNFESLKKTLLQLNLM